MFIYAQEQLGIPRGTVRATVLIETIHAAFEMDEILYELREHAAGLNAGRWDYIFSTIRKLPGSLLPDRAQVTMGVPFMRSYAELLVRTCHHRGAHAIGGMAAFIPSRKDAEVNRVALEKVREDKEREARAGFDGTWVAHPDLVPVAKEIFDRHLGDPFFGIFLNPGHQIGLDEWVNSPIRPGSRIELRSGMAFQVDIIPATGTPYFTTNIEELVQYGQNIREMADSHQATDDEIAKGFEQLLGELGR